MKKNGILFVGSRPIVISQCGIGACPVVTYDPGRGSDKQIVIKDDFANQIAMSVNQFEEIKKITVPK